MPAGELLLLDIAPNQIGSARHIARVRQADVLGTPCATAGGHLRLLLRKR